MDQQSTEIATRLMPPSYHAEPVGLPGLHLVWVDEIGRYAIVRFYADRAGGTAMVPVDYASDELVARRSLARLRRALHAALCGRAAAPAA